ncbi:MAG: SAF domain-containing protein [Acidimicrobiales bacterium]
MTQTIPPPTEEPGQIKTTSNGSAQKAEPLSLAPPRTFRSRVPQALLAALLIVGGGLGGLLLFNRYNQRTPAVVVVAPVDHGTALTRGDLAVTEVALDENVATIGSISEAVGRFAAHDLTPGELVTAGDLASEDQLVTAGESVIGLLLEPGQYPTKKLVAGDRVDVFAPGSEQVEAGPLASDLVVFDVVESSSDGRNLLVSVVVTAQQASAVFDAADSSGVRLSLRGQG